MTNKKLLLVVIAIVTLFAGTSHFIRGTHDSDDSVFELLNNIDQYSDFTAPQCIECNKLAKEYKKTECLVKYACITETNN